MSIKEKILQDFTNGSLENLTIKQIFNFYNIKKYAEKDTFRAIIDELCDELKIVCERGKYVLMENSTLLQGTIRCHERGFGFVTTKEGDYFIPPKKIGQALNGDTVLIAKTESSRGSTDEAEVVRVISRGISELIGYLYLEKSFGFVVPEDRAYFKDIFVSIKNIKGAKNGSKVLVKINSYPFDRNPEGEIVSVITQKNELKTAVDLAITNSGAKQVFSQEVLNELDKIPDHVSEKDKKGRLDLTNDLIITIDGDDSRDFDDAISIQKTEKGYKLGVHIADVSYYVQDESEIDKEAFERGTSIYFPEKVLPMLPEKLSNGICSLNPNVDRLALSCIMDIDLKGNVFNYEFANTVIRSKYRMTYKIVQKMIDGDEQVRKEYSYLCEMIDNCTDLYRILAKRRLEQGKMNLDSSECEIKVDEYGKISLSKRGRGESYQLIEEFMLIANETVAEHCYYLNVPFVYRIHEKPDEEKIATFCTFLKGLGIKTSWNERNYRSKDFNKLLDSISCEPYSQIVNDVLLRSMQKAKYSVEDVGHFGLACEHYCHFTSPIRRYPDLMVHRVLKQVLKDYERAEKYLDKCLDSASISSQRERRADELERLVDDIYKASYMKDYLGCEFEGVISGVASFGIFVQLENTVEGRISLEDLPSGKYYFDEKTFTLFSNRHSFKLGDKVKILVANCDVTTGKLDFVYKKGSVTTTD